MKGMRVESYFENNCNSQKEGEWGSAICDIMKPSEGDIVVKGKNGLCGFQSTNLDFLLRQNGIKNIVLGEKLLC